MCILNIIPNYRELRERNGAHLRRLPAGIEPHK